MRTMVAAAVAAALASMSSSCTASQGDPMTPQEARDLLIATIEESAALLHVPGWNSDGAPGVQKCGPDGTSAKYGYGYGAPQPDPPRDRHADAKKVADHWRTLGMTVRVIINPEGDPVVFSTGGPVSGLRFVTAAPGDYYIAGSSLCVPGDADDLRREEARR
ncbi:hypothetical protein [Microbacterium arborescens]|uniref:hypothetical protein n=1 Tax=Microbacterium arborescens TaxID=33883 RepID=UPI0025A0C0A4|nr:hypothetical protein [Microbacterium arborescens]WJM14896.1 hypothetical protein QUC20_11490 [Microbacterium arborescens]